MPLADDIAALIAAAEAVDAATATLRPLLADLDTAEQTARASLVSAGMGSRDHLAGGARLKSLALDLAADRGEMAGRALADVLADCWSPVVPQVEA